MRDPHNLRVAEMAMQVAVLTYELTKYLPAEERYGLASQMRRAAVSIGSAIWEGCGRSSDKQFLYFLEVANGSASELAFQAHLTQRLGFAGASEAMPLIDALSSTRRMLAKLSSSVRSSAPAVRPAKRTAL